MKSHVMYVTICSSILKMDVITETSLEALLQRATDCRNKTTDTAAIDAFCGIIKKEPEGPFIASKLIASKIQSTEEREALQGLTVLEICMKHCGSSFHSEIGKFRFLNEMIKLVSPKFLGPRTPTSVRNQVLKIMHSWTLNYPKEHKIKEAYDMLIKQGVIQKSDCSLENNPKDSMLQMQQKGNPLFQDEEKVRLLQKLLHSKNPDDLQAANRLIKTMVKEDEKRVEIKSKKISELETVKNNVRLLSEMLESYKLNPSSSDELDLIKELYQGCERLKPNVIRLASDAQDNDEFLNQVLLVNNELDEVLKKYDDIIVKEITLNEITGVNQESKYTSALLDLSTPVEELTHFSSDNKQCEDILCYPVLNTDSDCITSLPSLTSTSKTLGPAIFEDEPSKNSLDAIFNSIQYQNKSKEICALQVFDQPQKVEKPISVEKGNKMKAFKELDILSETLLQQCKIDGLSPKPTKNTESFSAKESINSEKLSDTELTNSRLNGNKDVLTSISCEGTPAVPKEENLDNERSSNATVNHEAKSLSDLFVSLENIKPSTVPPIKLIEEKNGISVTIHVAKDTPREDVTVFVITTLSKNPCSLTDYLFQAVVPKGCKLKLQPPSCSELPAYNPFLPPSAITQVMLIANPNNVNVTLKCMISYMVDGETFTEMGEVEKLNTVT